MKRYFAGILAAIGLALTAAPALPQSASPPASGLITSTNALPWANRQNLISPTSLQALFLQTAGILNGMGTWSPSYGYAPKIPNGYVSNSMLANDPSNASNLTSGLLPSGRLPAFTGDCTSAAGTSVLACAGGSGGGGFGPTTALNATSFGFVANGPDNVSAIPTLMTAMGGSFLRNSTGGAVDFPAIPGAVQTNYYFSKPFSMTRGGIYRCQGNGGIVPGVVNLVFAPGVDGMVQEFTSSSSDPLQTYSRASIENCSIISLGFGGATAVKGSGAVTGANFNFPGNRAQFDGMPIQAWGAGDGIIAYPAKQDISSGSGNVSGTTLTLTANWTVVGGTLVGQTLPDPTRVAAPSIITGLLSGTDGQAGATYSLSTGFTAATQVLNAFGNTGKPVFPTGAYLDSASGGSLTVHPGFEGNFGGNIATYQLPAAWGFKYTSTSGATGLTITQAPTNDPTKKLYVGDFIWSDAFPFGTLVTSVSGNAGAQTIGVRNVLVSANVNATQTHTSASPGTLWIVPAGIKRRITGQTHNVFVAGFGFGSQSACSSSMSPALVCNETYDEHPVYNYNVIGSILTGDNVGASVTLGAGGLVNYKADFIDAGGVGSVHLGDNSNCAEAKGCSAPIQGICTYASRTSWIGGYYGNSLLPYCIDPSISLDGPTSFKFGGLPPSVAFAPGGSPPDVTHFEGSNNQGNFIFGTQSTKCIELQGTFRGNVYDFSMSKDCGTVNSHGWYYNSTLDSWDFTSKGSPNNIEFRVPGPSYGGYARGDGRPSLYALNGIMLPNGTSLVTGSERLLDMGAFSPTDTWRQQGDVRFNNQATPGSNGCWINTAAGANWQKSCNIPIKILFNPQAESIAAGSNGAYNGGGSAITTDTSGNLVSARNLVAGDLRLAASINRFAPGCNVDVWLQNASALNYKIKCADATAATNILATDVIEVNYVHR